MRKKIPTITRPDPGYAAGLKVSAPVEPQRQEVTGPDPEGFGITRADEGSELMTPERPPAPHAEAVPDVVDPSPGVALPQSARTRKVDVRVTALERQAAALNASGINPAHVVRAALRRATKHWQLKPEFVPLTHHRTAKPSSWRMRTTVAVDAETLTAIMATEDPLDVCSKWSLIRGQLEPLVWQEIDRILSELADAAAQSEDSPPGSTATETLVED
ncbi:MULTISPECIES: hypothetical protein [Mameliella]|uniref:hypothetical protein n=1 Tax=Mameliella TaxID=1434019 RepID=UPI000B5378DE|nr:MULTISPECIES: hypothetical protein [Mameliella]OWV40229.1 hypothetical protein CDZ95_21975 [Mameliella alba]OWV58781.1 hypothetical protein CDZ97_20170 [Mameliella alba]